MNLQKIAIASLLMAKADHAFVPQNQNRPSQRGWKSHLKYSDEFTYDERAENQAIKNTLLYKEITNDPQNALPLLISGADPNVINSATGNSLLHELGTGAKSDAEQLQYLGLIEHLVKFGANTKHRNYKGLNATEHARNEGNNGIATCIEKSEKNKYVHTFDSSRSLQAVTLTSQKIDHVNDPTNAIDLLVTSMYDGLNIEQPYHHNDSPLNIAKKNWPKEQSDALQHMAACVNTTNTFLEELSSKGESVDSKDLLINEIKKQIKDAWGERVNPLLNYNNYDKGHFR